MAHIDTTRQWMVMDGSYKTMTSEETHPKWRLCPAFHQQTANLRAGPRSIDSEMDFLVDLDGKCMEVTQQKYAEMVI